LNSIRQEKPRARNNQKIPNSGSGVLNVKRKPCDVTPEMSKTPPNVPKFNFTKGVTQDESSELSPPFVPENSDLQKAEEELTHSRLKQYI
jgi:hypothetical protein